MALPFLHALSRLARAAAAIALLSVAALIPGRSEAASVVAQLDRSTVSVGNPVNLTVRVDGGSGDEIARLPAINGLRISTPSVSRQWQIINGRRHAAAETTFTITPLREGEYSIGPITVLSASQSLQADPVILRVVPQGDPSTASQGNQPVFLELKLPDRPVYLGETFVVEMFLYAVGGRVDAAPRLTANGFIVGTLTNDPVERNHRVNNNVYSRVRFYQTLTAARPGTLSVQATDCAVLLPVSTHRSAFSGIFDFPFQETQRIVVGTPAQEIRVVPLPRDNVPPSFAGAVGDFNIEVSASPTAVKTGDPVTVRIDVRGAGNFDSVRLPDNLGWAGFRTYPPTSNFTPDPDSLSTTGAKRFELVVTPLVASVSEIPPLEFSFFSPGVGQYRTVRSEAIALQVTRGASTPDIPQSEDASDLAYSGRPDFAPLKPRLGPVIAAGRIGVMSPAALAVWLAVPWAAWAAVALWKRRLAQSLSAQAAKRRRALDRQIDADLQNLRALAASGDGDAFFAALFRFLQAIVGARVGQPPAAITEGALDAELTRKGVDSGTIEALHRLFQACNQARYARVASRVDLESLIEEAATARRRLREEGRAAS